MNSPIIQLLVLAGIAVFLILRLRGVLGTREGFDIELTRAVCDSVGVPVIASGGVGSLQHLVDGVVQGHASGVLAASIFHFGEHTIAEAKALMSAQGVVVRPV